eukprot:8012483-Karenia_brevis.AAC.1
MSSGTEAWFVLGLLRLFWFVCSNSSSARFVCPGSSRSGSCVPARTINVHLFRFVRFWFVLFQVVPFPFLMALVLITSGPWAQQGGRFRFAPRVDCMDDCDLKSGPGPLGHVGKADNMTSFPVLIALMLETLGLDFGPSSQIQTDETELDER